MIRSIVLALGIALLLPSAAVAQDEAVAEQTPRAETGGATTLEDILRRQRGEEVDLDYRRNATGAADAGASL